MQTDGAHCRDFAGTGPVVLKIVRVTGAVFSGLPSPWTDQLMRPSLFSTPLYYTIIVMKFYEIVPNIQQ